MRSGCWRQRQRAIAHPESARSSGRSEGEDEHDRGGFGVDCNGGERVKQFLVGLTLVDMDLMDDRSCFSCYFS